MTMDGTLWVAYPDLDGRLLEGVLPDGSTGPTTRPECGADEEIGAFVLLDDGFVISWSGETISATSPAPTGRKAIAGPGQFLIGSQGYGAFTTGRFGRDGAESARWAGHGAMLVDKNGSISGPELENHLPSRSRFRRLASDNTLVDGPALTGYYTSYPAMDCEGTMVFWRDGKLLAVDADLAGRELFAMDDSRAVIGRALLLSGGSVVVSLDNEVLVFRTPLGPLAEGPWPCGGGNLRGNPLLS
ncbi:hypothetical protein [Streptomyces sp. NPDC056401]|uniref:hypothetical protein n=1 Tax=Streptomyces sp. NPDC056401 TaxID=3345809 RepID=UPI0035E333CC